MEAKAILGLVGGAVAAVLAPIQAVLFVLIGLMLCDFAVALVVNGKAGAWSPEQGYLGWRRKTVTLVLLLALAIAQHGLGNQSGYSLPAAQLVGGAFVALELVSLVKNAALVGIRLPKFLRAALGKLEDELVEREPAAGER